MKKAVFPKHLSKESLEWSQRIFETYELELHHVKLLTSAAECLDRIAECRTAIKRDGVFFKDRFQNIKPHPALQEERNHRIAFAKLVRELNLSEEPAESRPPYLKYGARS